jgi:TetR/AcrR family transcriptional regulator
MMGGKTARLVPIAIRQRPARSAARSRAAAPRRARGRPRGTPDIPSRLLDAALACYVQQGISATSLRDVARRAGVAPAMVNYYFGSAQGLRKRVVAERLLPVVSSVRDALAAGPAADPLAIATCFVDAVHGIAARHPWWPALWLREVMGEGGALAGLPARTGVADLAGNLSQRFAQARCGGRLASTLEPDLLASSLIGMALLPLAGPRSGKHESTPVVPSADVLRRHVLALFAGELRAAG